MRSEIWSRMASSPIMGKSGSPNTSSEAPWSRNPSSTMLPDRPPVPSLPLSSSGGTVCSRGGTSSLPLPVRAHSRTPARREEG